MDITKILNNIFKYKEKENYEFILPETANNIPEEDKKNEMQKIYSAISVV